MSEQPTDAQLKAVWDKVDKMKVGECVIIKNVAPNLPKVFVNCLKMYIDSFNTGEFNNDYSVFKKIEVLKDK